MKRIPSLLLALVIAPFCYAGEVVITDDGREVMLGDDGRWELVSDDRFATTASGERVRLRSDGAWEIVTDQSAQRHTPVQRPVDMGPVSWSLDDVTIETARGQRSATKKSVSKQTQTVFELRARHSAAESAAIVLQIPPNAVRVVDSGGREYPVLSITPAEISLSTEASARVVIRVDGSPHWFTTRFFEVQIAEQAVGNAEEIRLKRALSNVRKKDVDELPEGQLD